MLTELRKTHPTAGQATFIPYRAILEQDFSPPATSHDRAPKGAALPLSPGGARQAAALSSISLSPCYCCAPRQQAAGEHGLRAQPQAPTHGAQHTPQPPRHGCRPLPPTMPRGSAMERAEGARLGRGAAGSIRAPGAWGRGFDPRSPLLGLCTPVTAPSSVSSPKFNQQPREGCTHRVRAAAVPSARIPAWAEQRARLLPPKRAGGEQQPPASSPPACLQRGGNRIRHRPLLLRSERSHRQPCGFL